MNFAELLWPLFFPLLAFIIALIHIRWKHLTGWQVSGTMLMWQLAIGLGMGLILGGLGHLFNPDMVAKSIGWPIGSPFQREVGMWDVAIGIAALLCIWFRTDGYWLATLLGAGLFSVWAGLGHVYELVVHGDTAPSNAGGVMYLDLLYPLLLAALFIYYAMKKKEAGYPVRISD